MKTVVTICVFKRKRKSTEEQGIMLGEGDLIIDKTFTPVSEVWDYKILWSQGTLPIEL